LKEILAYPSHNEILGEKSLLEDGLRPFGQEIVKILQEKYYQRDGKVFGKKFI